jgi:hypothetical protein
MLPYAVGEKECKIKMGMPTPNGIVHHGMTKIVKEDNNDCGQYFEAEMRVPDVLFENEDRIDFIKMDVEGYEYIVLQNMLKVVRKHIPKIQMEISKNRPEIFAIMKAENYIPHILLNRILIPAGNNDLINHKNDFYFIHKTEF